MASVKLDSPGIGDEIAIAPGAAQVVSVQASLVGNVTPQDWTLRASSYPHPAGGAAIDEQQMAYDGTNGYFYVDVNAGQIPTGKPNGNNVLIQVTATKNSGASGSAASQCTVWIDDSSSGSCSSSDSSDGSGKPKGKAKTKTPILVANAKATLAKTKAKPAAAAKKPAPAARKATPAKKPKTKK
jgi:hypothetical protein